ncbi:MAG TPA: tetratricopeptide repeat protein, partial [Calditrichaeota bacterium]|nr:tetratricopeptide repeat protein [Calditrichota bacterium]
MKKIRRFHFLQLGLFIFLIGIVPSVFAQETYDQLLQKGQILYRQGKFEEASEVYEKAVDMDENRCEAYLALGNLYYVQ